MGFISLRVELHYDLVSKISLSKNQTDFSLISNKFQFVSVRTKTLKIAPLSRPLAVQATIPLTDDM